ncbi:class C sortase [Robinsoniella peoriensis]|uniref:Sortase n=1 Tax=Robinsoniella peoriensis TaxID=180332 RepID=A0A4U8Q563_9FIRM|nr:class C sortase [Robinsoniella peoriensis]MDU7026858.1 class C sortase [Clostridiales bacterium]TLC99403.1 sortase [Robinsoniella peoriensis]
MKKKKWSVLGLFLLLVGAGIILYPMIRQKMYEKDAQRVIRKFDEEHDDKQEKRNDSGLDGKPRSGAQLQDDPLYMAMEQYNVRLNRDGQEDLKDPYAYEEPGIRLEDYGISDRVAGYLKIPKMGIELPLYLGANEENMINGATQLTETSMPIGGINTNTVIAAHRGYSYAAMFRDIEVLSIGDSITLTNFWDTLTYEVIKTEVIAPTDIDKVFIQEGKDLVTLITCHPYRYNYQRYVVYCERIE